jgi:hypothetical protein
MRIDTPILFLTGFPDILTIRENDQSRCRRFLDQAHKLRGTSSRHQTSDWATIPEDLEGTAASAYQAALVGHSLRGAII